MNNRPIDELCKLLGVRSGTYEFTNEFGVSSGTMSNLNTGKQGSNALKFFLRLSLECLKELPVKKREKISQIMRENA